MNEIMLIDGSTGSPQANQVILVDKEAGWTSFDVVAKIRGILLANSQQPTANDTRKKLRVGHAGTLDPFATGLLIVLVGDATKDQEKFMKLDKEYVATIKLGYTSSTGDPEGVITKNTKQVTPKEEELLKILEKFLGEQEQTPPAFSAIKINGQRAYMLARRGKKAEIKPRKIKIYELEIINYRYPNLEVRVKCGSGTYIRTLAEDIGTALGTSAYLTGLRRTKVGPYSVEDAKRIEEVI